MEFSLSRRSKISCWEEILRSNVIPYYFCSFLSISSLETSWPLTERSCFSFCRSTILEAMSLNRALLILMRVSMQWSRFIMLKSRSANDWLALLRTRAVRLPLESLVVCLLYFDSLQSSSMIELFDYLLYIMSISMCWTCCMSSSISSGSIVLEPVCSCCYFGWSRSSTGSLKLNPVLVLACLGDY